MDINGHIYILYTSQQPPFSVRLVFLLNFFILSNNVRSTATMRDSFFCPVERIDRLLCDKQWHRHGNSIGQHSKPKCLYNMLVLRSMISFSPIDGQPLLYISTVIWCFESYSQWKHIIINRKIPSWDCVYHNGSRQSLKPNCIRLPTEDHSHNDPLRNEFDSGPKNIIIMAHVSSFLHQIHKYAIANGLATHPHEHT